MNIRCYIVEFNADISDGECEGCPLFHRHEGQYHAPMDGDAECYALYPNALVIHGEDVWSEEFPGLHVMRFNRPSFCPLKEVSDVVQRH